MSRSTPDFDLTAKCPQETKSPSVEKHQCVRVSASTSLFFHHMYSPFAQPEFTTLVTFLVLVLFFSLHNEFILFQSSSFNLETSLEKA